MKATLGLAVGVALTLWSVPSAYAGGVVTTPITGLSNPSDVASADFDANGIADLAIPEPAAQALVIALGQGAGRFTSLTLPQSGHPEDVAVGDLDKDGRPDVATLSRTDRLVELNVQDSHGGWATVALNDVGIAPAGLAVGDLNGDGWGDIAVNDAGADAHGDFNLRLFIRDAVNGGYDERTLKNFPDTGDGGPRAVTIGDIDRNRRADVVTANGFNEHTVSVFSERADGGYDQRHLSVPGRRRADAVAVGHLGGSGPGRDIAAAFGAGTSDSVAVFEEAAHSFELFAGSRLDAATYHALAALTLDGLPALAAASSDPARGLTVWVPNRAHVQSFATPEAAAGLAAGDFDGDGRADIATLLPGAGKVLLVSALTDPPIFDSCGNASVSSVRARASCSRIAPTLFLGIDAKAVSFGTFAPGVAKTYTATTKATVISTFAAAALTLSVPGKLTNGGSTLANPLWVSLSKSAWYSPVANEPVKITFAQRIGATEPLRTGTYSQTVTFTLSPLTP
jgi:hypothetical protein